MMDETDQPTYDGYRHPREVIGFAVWAYHRFPLSLRELGAVPAARGIEVMYETIRAWSRDFGPVPAPRLAMPAGGSRRQAAHG